MTGAGLEEDVVTLTQRLVRVPTENPPGDTRAACDIVAAELSASGFDVQYVEDEPGFVSVLGEYRFCEDGPTLVLNGHVDVVPVGDSAAQWTHDPFGGEVDGGRIYGRGTLDMKGAVAAIVVAAKAAARSGSLRGRLVVMAVADEEQGGGRGTGAIVRRGLVSGDGAIVVEPGDAGIVIGHRGLCFVEVTTHGRSSHATQPENGINAVQLMVDALTALRTVQLEHSPHPIFGGPSVVVGTSVHGGHKTNVIPDSCVATLDIRTVPGMTQESVARDLEEHLAAADLEVGAQVSVRIASWGEPGETDEDARIVQVCGDVYEETFGHRPEIRHMPAYTDGGWLANFAGIPTIMAFGPGMVSGAHVVDECLEIDDLVTYTAIYRRVIDRFLAVE